MQAAPRGSSPVAVPFSQAEYVSIPFYVNLVLNEGEVRLVSPFLVSRVVHVRGTTGKRGTLLGFDRTVYILGLDGLRPLDKAALAGFILQMVMLAVTVDWDEPRLPVTLSSEGMWWTPIIDTSRILL